MDYPDTHLHMSRVAETHNQIILSIKSNIRSFELHRK